MYDLLLLHLDKSECIYSAATVDEAEVMLTQFETKWGKNY